MRTNKNHIKLPDIVGKGYGTYWRFKGRYRICKGSRASKKSKTTALWYITNMMKYSGANTLVIRKTFRTLKDSCFTELKWAISRLCVQAHWKITESPLQMEYIPTGQRIYFRGLDDPLKVTSITVDVGSLCWMWIEEAYEIMKEDDFNILDESIRGQVQEGLFKQITLTFNPWNKHHWIKKRFFDINDKEEIIKEFNEGKIKRFKDEDGENVDTFSLTTNYTINEWLDKSDLAVFNRMKEQNPRRYRVAGLGDWGIVDGLVYENWKEEAFDLEEIKKISGIKSAFGLDFGYTNDPSALWCGMVDLKEKNIYVFDEMYGFGMSNTKIHAKILDMGYIKEKIIADCAVPKDIDHLRELGIRNIKASRKGNDSVNNGIQYIQDFQIIIHPKCVNFLTEISNYTWDEDKFGKKINKPIGDFNHLCDAMRYGMQDFIKGEIFSFD